SPMPWKTPAATTRICSPTVAARDSTSAAAGPSTCCSARLELSRLLLALARDRLFHLLHALLDGRGDVLRRALGRAQEARRLRRRRLGRQPPLFLLVPPLPLLHPVPGSVVAHRRLLLSILAADHRSCCTAPAAGGHHPSHTRRPNRLRYVGIG